MPQHCEVGYPFTIGGVQIEDTQKPLSTVRKRVIHNDSNPYPCFRKQIVELSVIFRKDLVQC